MERRLLTNFHIGVVDGVMNDILNITHEPKDVFTQIAKAINRHTNSKKKKDWNTLVRSNTVMINPIGSAREAEIRQNRRQSLRKHIIAESKSNNIDPSVLLGMYYTKYIFI